MIKQQKSILLRNLTLQVNISMEYEIYTFINCVGVVIIALIILYHFIGKIINLFENIKQETSQKLLPNLLFLTFYLFITGVKTNTALEGEEDNKEE